MSTTKLQLYNIALGEYLGERRLASLTEAREPRRILDEIWDNGALKFCLEQGHWKFAQRATRLDANTAITPPFGYPHVFTRPTDCVKVSMICTDEYFKTPLTDYVAEGGTWSASVAQMYVSYVSNDSSYGLDMSLWPETFVQLVASYLAHKSGKRITQTASVEQDVEKAYHKNLVDARSKDAMEGPTRFMPTGSWVRSRNGSMNGDRGNRGSLIG